MGKRGLFIGLCNLDIIYYSDTLMPGDNCKKKITDYRMAVGGPAANAAITFAMLGGEACLYTSVGSSPMGMSVKQMLAELGVKVVDVAERDVECNVSCIHVNTTTGDRTILSGQSGRCVNPEVLSGLEKLIETAAFVLYDGNLPGVESELAEALSRHQKELVLDAGSYKPGFVPCFQVKPTVISSESFADEAGRDVFALDELYGFSYSAQTRGGAPLRYLRETGVCEMPVRSAVAVDTLGAGDIFHGAYCYFKYCKNLPFEKALACAADFASYTVEKCGVVDGIRYGIKNYSFSYTTNTLR